MPYDYGFEIMVKVYTKNSALTYQYNKNADKSTEIHFTVPFSTETQKQITEIVLYNINPGHFNSIQRGDKVELFAGYHDDNGLLMSGTIFRTSTPTLEGADTAYTLRVLEGPDYTTLPKLNITFAKGTYAETIVREVVRRAGISLNLMNTNINKRYDEEYTAEGHPLEILSQIAEDTKTSLFYLRGKLTWAFIFAGRNAETFNLNVDTGLIGSPVVESRDDDWQDGDDDDGLGRWSFSCESILNFHLTTFSRVEVHSKYLNHGMYVINGEHSFDGEQARTKFEGIEN
ncbi:hypothetical protein G8B22_08710 [Ligilactobacillus agilis]|uniref:phage protein n=1 Tax=Ligilactobacillus agilis TaxID=1601 RepID=UPI001F57941E|nr:hypothetical protein [Ligilactobacillus agilis]UNL43206.1 hypothetical protein G8B22_08710 [Ligilactobacillus agilis]UNL57796.1 hypothetical protein G8B19_03000 [Ligilactobacillus agilis]